MATEEEKKEEFISKFTKPKDYKAEVEALGKGGNEGTFFGVPFNKSRAEGVAGLAADYGAKAVVGLPSAAFHKLEGDDAAAAASMSAYDTSIERNKLKAAGSTEPLVQQSPLPAPAAPSPGVDAQPAAAPAQPDANQLFLQKMAEAKAKQQAAASKGLKEATKGYLASLKSANDAALKINRAQAASADAVASEHSARAAMFQRQAQDEMVRQEIRRQRETEAIETYKQRSDEAWKQAQAVGREQYWQSKGTGVRILSMFAGMLAGAAGPQQLKQYQDTLNNAIDKDVQEQMYRANATEKRADASFNAYKMLRDQGASDAEARGVARQLGLQQALAQLDSLTARNNSSELRAKSDEIRAGLQKELANIQLQSAKAAAAAAYAPPPRAKGTNLFVPALRGYANSEKEAQELRAKSAETLTIQRNMLKAAEIRKNLTKADMAAIKSGTFNTTNSLRLKSLVSSTMPLIAVANKQGAIADGEAVRFTEGMGSLMDSTGEPWVVAQEYADNLGKNFEATREAYNIQDTADDLVSEHHGGKK